MSNRLSTLTEIDILLDAAASVHTDANGTPSVICAPLFIRMARRRLLKLIEAEEAIQKELNS